MKSWWAIVLGAIFGLLSAGIILLASQPPRGNAIVLLPPPTPIPIQVHISGEITNPGVNALSPESRVQDAIQAAGGLTSEANSSGLNLAALLEDGMRVQVPAQIPTETSSPLTGADSKEQQNSSQTKPSAVQFSSNLININTASHEELETLSGIGPATALKIIAFWEENGLFTSIEEIQKVSGIGPVTFEKIEDFITVGEP